MEDASISVPSGSLLETTNVKDALVNVKYAMMKQLVKLAIQDTMLKMEFALRTVEMDGLLIQVDNAENALTTVSDAQLLIQMIA
jgi:hypothetical protein